MKCNKMDRYFARFYMTKSYVDKFVAEIKWIVLI